MSGFNASMIWGTTCAVTLFIGTRPIDRAFVDMVTYASSFNFTIHTGVSNYSDWGFNYLTEACASLSASAEIYFLVCAILYIGPLAIGMHLRHKEWGFAAFLALLGGFSFFPYAANGIRNGIATSLLIAAFALSDKKVIMVLLFIAAEGMHKSALVPIVAFLVAIIYSRPSVYFSIWTFALGLSTVVGERLSNFWIAIASAREDDRAANYAAGGSDAGGFRPDFVLYSIMPVVISYSLASLTTKRDLFYRRLLCCYLAANSIWLMTMYAAFSNRFAYLSWFMLPWVVIYPYLPTVAQRNQPIQVAENTRTNFLGLALVTHFAFTYVMVIFVYPNRAS